MSDEMDEIWVLYADDGAQAMDAMEAALLSLQDCPPEDAPGLVAALFRAVHTFKGNSRVLGLETVESRAHLAEDLIGLVRDQGVTLDEEILALLLETSDRFREMLDETARNRADVDPASTEGLLERLKDKIARCSQALGEKDNAEATGSEIDADEQAVTFDEEDEPQVSSPVPDPSDAVETDPATAEISETPPREPNPSAAEMPSSEDTREPQVSGPKLSEDAAYLAIFNDMVQEALAKLRTAEQARSIDGVGKALARLDHAARQLGLELWRDVLSALPAEPQIGDLDEIIEAIAGLASSCSDIAAAGPEMAPDFFQQISEALATVSRLGLEYTLGTTPDRATLEQAASTLHTVSGQQGYVRVASAVRSLTAAEDAVAFRHTELRLYEELASVEATVYNESLSESLSPKKLLQKWSADHVLDTLDDLDQTLEKLRSGKTEKADHRKLEQLIRLVHYACGYFRLEIASDLAMSILDLFSRTHMRGERPDAILLQIARGFTDTLVLVFDAVREGEEPNTERLEELFREAADAGFIGAGTVSASAIERRLGLPAEFHKVLSPESTRAAGIALDQGMNFYILRADINSDDVLAGRLFDLIGSGKVQALTNVTVFEGDKTIFDFLLASALDEVELTETIAVLDPEGRHLVLLKRLAPVLQTEPDGLRDASDGSPSLDPESNMEISSDILEQLGEVAAGQAMLQNMLGDLSNSDLSETLDSILRQYPDDRRAARQALRAVGDQLTEQLREVTQLGTQILGHLSELQQLTANLRTRAAATILRPLAAMVSTQARNNGFEAVLTTTGAEEALDVTMLHCLRSALQPFLQQRLAQPVQAPRRLHMAIRKQDDQVSIILDDDGAIPPAPEMVARMEVDILQQGGSVRVIRRPEGGFRLHLFVPINLVVLEGMVVEARQTKYVVPVSAIRSILQPDPAALVPVSGPEGKGWWLRLNKEELIPVQEISAGRAPSLACQRDPDLKQIYVILSLEENCVALPVDELLGQQLVLSRPLRGVMTGLQRVSGVALLSRGDVAMVLSPDSFCVSNTGANLTRH